MTLQPYCRFVVPPRFHFLADWPRRLLVRAEVEESDGCFIPQTSWRSPTTDELAMLAHSSVEPASPEELADCVCLFQLPRHFRSAWWNLLEEAAGVLGDGRLPGLEAFVSQVAEFLAFKDLPLPEGARCDVVVSKPGQQFVPWRPRVWGGINLGDEPTSVLLINPSRRPVDAVRLILGPGEGCRLPRDGLIVIGYPGDKQEPDVLLLISQESS
jgi:hypothetical protein